MAAGEKCGCGRLARTPVASDTLFFTLQPFRMKRRPVKLIALIALCLLLAGCAQTGAPLPPSLELPKPPTDVRANRKGNHVILSWSEPTLTTDRQGIRYLGPTLICRSLESEITVCGDAAATLPVPSAALTKPESRRSAAQKPGPP